MKTKQILCLPLFFMLVFVVSAQDITGNGKIARETRNITDFVGVDVGGGFDVFIRQGNSFKVEIEADENIIGSIETTVSDQTLKIKHKKSIQNASKLNIYITLPELKKLAASGGVDVFGKTTFTTSMMEIVCSGGSDVVLDIRVEEASVVTSGSADLRLTGSGNAMSLVTSGSSDFHGENFKVKTGDITTSGSSDAHVHVTETLSAVASGSSDLRCEGNPSSRKALASGSAEIQY